MDTNELTDALFKLFKHTGILPGAKQDLKQRLFGATELSDDDLSFVAAAGDLSQQHINEQGGAQK